MDTVDRIIALLNLQPLPGEGGLYAETYRAEGMIPQEVLPSRYTGPRSYGTAIYYMLTPDTFSALHRLQGDEVYHFYLGDPVELLRLWPDGTGKKVILGTELLEGMQPQVVVPRGVWQGSRLLPGGRFALMGTTMAPGFDVADYEGAARADLLQGYPQFRQEIAALTRQ